MHLGCNVHQLNKSYLSQNLLYTMSYVMWILFLDTKPTHIPSTIEWSVPFNGRYGISRHDVQKMLYTHNIFLYALIRQVTTTGFHVSSIVYSNSSSIAKEKQWPYQPLYIACERRVFSQFMHTNCKRKYQDGREYERKTNSIVKDGSVKNGLLILRTENMLFR